jgi:hypothetical protein
MADIELFQLERVINGQTVYAWKPEGSVDPMENDVVWLPSGSTPPVGYEAWKMSFAYRGTRGKAGKGQWAVCSVCRYEAPRSEMVYYKGKWYCTRYGCAEDIV